VPIKARTIVEAGFPVLLSAGANHRGVCPSFNLDNIFLHRFVFPPAFQKLGPHVKWARINGGFSRSLFSAMTLFTVFRARKAFSSISSHFKPFLKEITITF
jgi:hypothetical protein